LFRRKSATITNLQVHQKGKNKKGKGKREGKNKKMGGIKRENKMGWEREKNKKKQKTKKNKNPNGIFILNYPLF
jgi:hypothetical protein